MAKTIKSKTNIKKSMKQLFFIVSFWKTIVLDKGKDYDTVVAETADVLRYDDIKLKGSVLDPNMKHCNTTVVSMIDRFEKYAERTFIPEFDFNGYIEEGNRVNVYDLVHNGVVYEYKHIFSEEELSEIRSVVCVIYKIVDGVLYIADHLHEEDDTFGYPSSFHSVPGGRRDTKNPFQTFFTEAYEELLLDNKEFFQGSVIRGYEIGPKGVLYIFCEVASNREVNTCKETRLSVGFHPFTLKVFVDDPPVTDSASSKDHIYKVLIPRQTGMFDAVSAKFCKVNFNGDTLFGIDGRYGCYKKGSIIYEGLKELLHTTQKI